mgnify:CR=1 FL=1|jgi:DNA-binding YbaB/EbfC family protein
MFDQFKAMGAVAGLLKDKERLRETAQRVRDRLEQAKVAGESGGGAVRVTASGAGRVLSVQVEPALAAGFGDGVNRAIAESLIAEAVNDALARAKEAAQKIIEEEAAELGLGELLPGMRGLMP